MKRFSACMIVGAAILVSACTPKLEPRSTIVATDLRHTALNDSVSLFGAELGETDPFVTALDDAQTRFENNFLKLETGASGEISVIKYGQDALPTYVQGRITQINDLCKIYFDGLVRRADANEVYKGGISLASNLASGILGLTGAAAFQLSVLALSEAAALGSFENYENVYLLAPSPEGVFIKVRQAQEEFMTEHQDQIKSNSTSYPIARDTVRAYAALCTPERIRTMINRDLADNEEDGSGAASVATAGIVQAIGNTISRQSLSVDQAADILIVVGLTSATSAQESDAAARLAKDSITLTSAQKADLAKQLPFVQALGGAKTIFDRATSRVAIGT